MLRRPIGCHFAGRTCCWKSPCQLSRDEAKPCRMSRATSSGCTARDRKYMAKDEVFDFRAKDWIYLVLRTTPNGERKSRAGPRRPGMVKPGEGDIAANEGQDSGSHCRLLVPR